MDTADKKKYELIFENKDLRIIMPKLKSYINSSAVKESENFNFLFSYKGNVFSFNYSTGVDFIEDYDKIIRYNSFKDIPEQVLSEELEPLFFTYISGAKNVISDIDDLSEVKVVGRGVTCFEASPLNMSGDPEDPRRLKLIFMFSPLLPGNTSALFQLPVIDRIVCMQDEDKKRSAIVHSPLSRGEGTRPLLNSLFRDVDLSFPDFCYIDLPEQDPEIKDSKNSGMINTFISSLSSKFPLQYSIDLGDSSCIFIEP